MNPITYIATEIPSVGEKTGRAAEMRFLDGRKVLLADYADDVAATNALSDIEPGGPKVYLHRVDGVITGIHTRNDGKAPPKEWWKGPV